MVRVKPLDMAIQVGNIARAVIQATNCCQDGRTPVVSQPSSRALDYMIRDSCIKGGLDIRRQKQY